jgi:hypothetical protein
MAKYPANFTVEYPETLSRGKTALQGLFGWLYAGIPHGIILYFYGIAAAVVTVIAFFAIIFTRKYPKGLYDFVVGYHRWSTRVTAFLVLLRNEYPPFTNEE